MSGLGMRPATNDIIVNPLRELSNSIYNPIFKSFSKIQEIVTSEAQNINKFSIEHNDKNAARILDDVNWLKESLEEDFAKLNKIENHVKFINADETLTNQKEIVGVLVEFGEFFEEMVLGNLTAVLQGVWSSVGDDKEELKQSLSLNGVQLIDVVGFLTKYKLVVKLLTDQFKKVEAQKFTTLNEVSGLNLQEFESLKRVIDKVLKSLDATLEDLNKL